MKQIKLSERLAAIAERIPVGARVADIGTDHARLPVYLLQRELAAAVIATDLLEGPLERARATLAFWNLDTDSRISLRMGDGLSPLSPDETDAVVIAGMGGGTIAGILAACPWIPEARQDFILQPMSSAEELREGLYKLGFEIRVEQPVLDNGNLYTVILAGRGTPAAAPEPWTLYVSQALLSGTGPLRDAYVERMIHRLERALEGARQSTKALDAPRAGHFAAALEGLKKAAGR